MSDAKPADAKTGFVGATEDNPLGIEGARQKLTADLEGKNGVGGVGLGYDDAGNEVLVVTLDEEGARGVPKEFDGFAVRTEVRADK